MPRAKKEHLCLNIRIDTGLCRRLMEVSDVFQKRNEWLVDHSNRLIAYFNGAPGGTWDTIAYAHNKGIEVIANNPEYVEKVKKTRKPKEEPVPKTPYPENLITDIGLQDEKSLLLLILPWPRCLTQEETYEQAIEK